MKYLFLILSLSIFGGCTSQYADLYSTSQRAGWHKIDLGSFELEAPKAYKYKRIQGIDSYVGQISNGKTTFEFDYGWYSNNKPLTPKEIFEDTKTVLYWDELAAAFEGKFGRDGLLFKIQEELIIKDVWPQGNGQFLARLEMDGQHAEIRFEPFVSGYDAEYFQYEILEMEDEFYYKKIYIPKELKTGKRAGVYIADLKSKKENPYGYNQLAFYTFDMKPNNQKELAEILRTVGMR